MKLNRALILKLLVVFRCLRTSHLLCVTKGFFFKKLEQSGGESVGLMQYINVKL